MKQSSLIARISESINSLDTDSGIVIKGFHPDLLLPTIKRVSRQLLIYIPDQVFESVAKYLSPLWEDNSAALLPPAAIENNTPIGFSSFQSRHLNRAKELLSDGLKNIQTIICAESSKTLPIVDCGLKNQLVFSKPVSFDECHNFLRLEGYVLVDFVTAPGEYSLRGGIIDVYPFSSFNAHRINFLDDVPIVYRFNVDSQLTSSTVSNFILSSIGEKQPNSLMDLSMDSFLCLVFEDNSRLTIGNPSWKVNNFTIDKVPYRKFYSNKDNTFNSVIIDEDLSSLGFLDEDNNIVVPRWYLEKGIPNERTSDSIAQLDLSEIKRGDYLVHRDHGVGMCMGLILKSDGGSSQELLSLKYDDGGCVSVDTGSLDLISFYASADTENISMDSLSKRNHWGRKKRSAKKRAEEVMQHLLNLYVQRNDLYRTPFPKDDVLEKSFLSSFSFEDTPDQKRVWGEISKDLSGKYPMDRLLCGDVGFGKTEMAIRAAFRVVISKKRVLVLAPTTILANQLKSSFSSRLEPWAVSVDLVSRFRSQTEIKEIKDDICTFNNDVLIGTHALLNDDVYLKNVGLLIVDEEHRFGVKHKEKIRGLNSSIDVLFMSATPIPRSMNLALSGIYSISMIQTPPKFRLPIKTQVECFSDNIIKEVVEFELGRGGQVYFVHNDVNSIKYVSNKIQGLVNKCVVEFIHGQESAKNIESKMADFVAGKIDVLVCTSIIESGIDVPDANSIIINNSHLFGLSQLYQMRGRVGRGFHQAYAYLLLPKKLSLSDKALKRIRSIEDNISLGSGYNVSITDMDIRGSGALFGYNQSGGGSAMGYEMYTRMVQRVLHESGKLKSRFRILPEDVTIGLYEKRYIPEGYISIESVRMSVYKNIATAIDEKGLESILYNLENRFGPVPKPIKNLIYEARLKIKASQVGVNSLVKGSCGVVCCIENRDEQFFASALLDYINEFLNVLNIKYHIVPIKKDFLSICIHLDKSEDSYSIFSRFFGKFNALVKVN